MREKGNRALLLQFILSDLICAHQVVLGKQPSERLLSTRGRLFPYDWSSEVGSLNKLIEHAHLLKQAFPDYQEQSHAFRGCLDTIIHKVQSNSKEQNFKGLNSLFHHLLPFLILAKESESLLLYLLQNKEAIYQIAGVQSPSELINQIFPEGLERLSILLKEGYAKRGFAALLPEIDNLLSGLLTRALKR